jgi:hypothetical protein
MGELLESNFQQLHAYVITVFVITDPVVLLPELLRDGFHLVDVKAPGYLPLLLVWLSLSLDPHAVADT